MFDEVNHKGMRNEKVMATLILFGTLTLGFLIALLSNRNIDNWPEKMNSLGAAYPVSIWHGEVWRYFTAPFLQNSLLLYLVHGLMLFQLGRILEPLYGASRFFLIFVLSGAFGFSVATLLDANLYFGASFAIFGLLGALLGARLNLQNTKIDSRLLGIVGFYILISILPAERTVSGHAFLNAFGFIASLGIGLILGFAFLAENNKWKRISTPLLALGLSLFFLTFLVSVKPQFLPSYHKMMAIESLRMKEFPISLEHASWLSKKPGSESDGEIISSRIFSNLGESERAHALASRAFVKESDAARFWQKSMFQDNAKVQNLGGLFFDEKGSATICRVMLEKKVEMSEVLNDCAWLFLVSLNREVRDPQRALELSMKAMQLTEKVTTDQLKTLAEAYLQNGKIEEAIQTIERGMILGNDKESQDFRMQKELIEREITQAN